MKTRFVYVWEFQIAADAETEFRRHYGPDGSWVVLFRSDSAYIESLLLNDELNPRRYLTLDRWQSAEAYRSFRERFAKQYEALDRLCERLTVHETSLGSYSEIVPAQIT